MQFRVAIVGVGQVGAAAAYALILQSIASELLLVDVNSTKREAQVHDLSDVAYGNNSNTRVRSATYHEAAQCDIIVIAAGAKHFMGDTSISHINNNVGIMRSVINAMTPLKSDSILFIVANPVDLLTQIAHELSGLPTAQVIGSGTLLDSVRVRGLLADQIGIPAKSLDIPVLGVQGDSQVIAWSSATVYGVPIAKHIPPNTINHEELASECRDTTRSILKAKGGAEPFGIGWAVASVCSSIRSDKCSVQPLSHFQRDFGCCFSSAVVLGRTGIIREVPTPLVSEEKTQIVESVEVLKETISHIYEK